MVDMQVLFNHFAQAMQTYFKQDVFVALDASECVKIYDNSLCLFDITACINGKSAFDGVAILSVEDSFVNKLLELLFGGCCDIDCDVLEIKQDSIGELLNIFIGKALTCTGCTIEHVTFDVPHFVDGNTISFDVKRHIWVQQFQSKFGAIKMAILSDVAR